MRVRDLEIAMVLAREMKAAAARSVDASLRVEQLQEVFGAEQLDRAERTRIQTALQMAGLEPRPSLLEADPGTAIRFGIGENAPAPSPEPSQAPAGEPQGEPSRDEFPTVGEFARSTFQRARRRFSGAGEANGRHETVIATAEAAAVDEAEAEHVATDPDHPAGPAFVEDHVDEIQSPSFGGPSESPDAPAAGEDPFDFEDPEDVEEPAEQDEPDAGQETVVHEQPVLEDEPHEEALAEEAEADAVAAGSLNGHAPHEPDAPALLEEEDQHAEPVPEPVGEDPVAIQADPAPAPPATAAALPELLAALLPAVAIPVIVTSVAGWRFGLPFVAFSVIATGLLMRRAAGDAAPGPLAALRGSAPARAVLKMTALVAILSGVAAVLLASAHHDSATVSKKSAPAAKAPPAAAPKQPSKPAAAGTAPRHAVQQHHRRHARPPADNGTAGLVRVPPRPQAPASGSSGTGTTGSGGSPSVTPGR